MALSHSRNSDGQCCRCISSETLELGERRKRTGLGRRNDKSGSGLHTKRGPGRVRRARCLLLALTQEPLGCYRPAPGFGLLDKERSQSRPAASIGSPSDVQNAVSSLDPPRRILRCKTHISRQEMEEDGSGRRFKAGGHATGRAGRAGSRPHYSSLGWLCRSGEMPTPASSRSSVLVLLGAEACPPPTLPSLIGAAASRGRRGALDSCCGAHVCARLHRGSSCNLDTGERWWQSALGRPTVERSQTCRGSICLSAWIGASEIRIWKSDQKPGQTGRAERELHAKSIHCVLFLGSSRLRRSTRCATKPGWEHPILSSDAMPDRGHSEGQTEQTAAGSRRVI